jgi:hypothetical protein
MVNGGVQFFSVGKLCQRTLVIYMKKRGVRRPMSPEGNGMLMVPQGGSAFRALEVDQHVHPRMGAQAASSWPQEWFRTYRKFSVPYEVHDLVFISADHLGSDLIEKRQYIAILRDGGFDVMDLVVVATICEIPNLDGPLFGKLAKRCDARRPLGMFRANANEFLLCYNGLYLSVSRSRDLCAHRLAEFGLYVDQHGDLLRATAVVEWEGAAERAAHHPPYVLLFDPDFIEVRHVETGRLVQLITGKFRCLWDGRIATPSGVCTVTGARVHAMGEGPTIFALVPVKGLDWGTESDS